MEVSINKGMAKSTVELPLDKILGNQLKMRFRDGNRKLGRK